MPKKNYGYHPGYPAYLASLERFLRACGGISREADLDFCIENTRDQDGNIRIERLSSGQRETFRLYYASSAVTLKESLRKKQTTCREVWRELSVTAAMIGGEVSIVTRESDDVVAWKNYRKFYHMLTSPKAVCDLRDCLYAWIEQDRKKIAAGRASLHPSEDGLKPLRMLSIEAILTRYSALLVKRRNKKA